MKRILSVTNPIITHDPPTADLLSILGTNPNTESWIMNNFVNIYIHKDEIFYNFMIEICFSMVSLGYRLFKYDGKSSYESAAGL